MRTCLRGLAATCIALSATAAHAQVPPPEPVTAERTYPAIGGHLGMALPIVTFSTEITAIGADFVTLGLTPGITVHLDDRWAIDFEFIAFNELKETPALTTFVVDPGVIYKFDHFVLGMRVATQVGAPTNLGLVPIFVLPVEISERVSWFAELDLPVFIRDRDDRLRGSVTVLFQTGFGF